MRSAVVLVSLLVVTWITATEASLIGAALALGGLAALKGAALVGYSLGRHSRRPRYYGHYGVYNGGYYHGHYSHGHNYRYGRSVEASPADEGEDLLLAAVGQLDPNGCVLKLLCQLQIKEESTRTLEENVLVDMFANGTETPTAYNAAFVYATDIGIKTQDSYACKKYFPNCPLTEEQLGSLLQQAWGCGYNFFEERTDEAEMAKVPDQDLQTTGPLDAVTASGVLTTTHTEGHNSSS